ncbi:Uncharacterized membrane protein YgdD, TMEM256/DUF423 family [Flavobacterium xanthum]|uniref:Uncharacterized membrane protein YgdD, TMEM256/DUF423 family n=2 Tax=Flavobacterium xanthum TaxID=69322 RepID=A0A1M7F8Y6_9FLAO|nr:Uncharacterized membrane protein YgdD, TMEM256/DUF423 family [Flavobacterium xanthum]
MKYFCNKITNLMDKKILSTGAILGMIAIILGAFGAHALKKVLTIDQLATFETGVRYQMYHAIFLLFIGLTQDLSLKTKKTIYLLVVFGVLLFSGSIYLLATNDLTAFDFKIIGFVTPIGGLLLIVAWSILLLRVLNKKSQN